MLKQIKIAQQPNIEEILVLDQKIDKIKNHESIDINIFFDQAKIEFDNWRNFIDKYVELNIKNEQIIKDCINNSDLSPDLKLEMIDALNVAHDNFVHLIHDSFAIQKKMIIEFKKVTEIAERNLGKAEIIDNEKLKLLSTSEDELLEATLNNIAQYNQQLAELAKKYNIKPNLSN